MFFDQLPGLGSQTSLSLQECLRLLEATFPFGEEAEVKKENIFSSVIYIASIHKSSQGTAQNNHIISKSYPCKEFTL